MLIKVEAHVWYNLEHNTTRRNDYTTGESNFCRIFHFQNGIFDANFEDILKSEGLKIFKKQQRLQKKLCVRSKNGLYLPWLSSLVPPPEFDPSKKLILVKGLPKGTRPRKSCEIQGGGLNLTTTVM